MKWVIIPLICLIGANAPCMGASQVCGAVDKSVGRARQIILASDLHLSEQESAVVLEECPTYRIYPLAGDYVEYQFEWRIGDVRLTVSGRGDISKLDGAEVIRTTTQKGK
jgi:hypothetical protein